MLDPQKAKCLFEIAEAVGNIHRNLFLLLNGGLNDSQKAAIDATIHNLNKWEVEAITAKTPISQRSARIVIGALSELRVWISPADGSWAKDL